MKTAMFLKAFRVPLKYKIAIWFVASLNIACGIYLSILHSDWRWLSRFGALIVIASLVLEATGLVQKFIGKVFKIVNDIMPEIVEMQVKRCPHLYGLSGKETPEQLKDIAAKELQKRVSETSTSAEKAVNNDLRKTEFWIASIGTLLWAFADLLN